MPPPDADSAASARKHDVEIMTGREFITLSRLLMMCQAAPPLARDDTAKAQLEDSDAIF